VIVRRLLAACFWGAVATASGAAFTGVVPATPAPAPTGTVLYGGGSTLRPTAPGERNDLFGFFGSIVRGTGVDFCRTSSGVAKSVFTQASSAALSCEPYMSGGFGAPRDVPDFASSAVPLDAADVAAFFAAQAAGVKRGEPVQIPYIASSVALFFDNPDVRGHLRLSVGTLCKIADGEISDWSQIPLDPTNPSGPVYPKRTLHFVYRSDPAGTTFALSNFLSSTGPSAARHACTRSGQTFALSDVFATGVLPRPLPPSSITVNFLAARGAAAALDCIMGVAERCAAPGKTILATGGPGAIGYVDAIDAFAPSLQPPYGIALLYVVRSGVGQDEDPIADLPGVATSIKSYEIDSVLGAFVPNGRPLRELVPLAATPKKPGCIAVVSPAAYAFPNVGYPIVSITNLEFASAGNGVKAAALRTLATLTNDGKNFVWKKIRTVDADNIARGTRGLSVLPLPAGGKTGIPSVASCIGV
jgi:hypothetical protein